VVLHEKTDKKAIHFIEGEWVEGNPPLLGPMTHGSWMSSVVFDGARAFEGVAPDLDRHCQRVIDSAGIFGLTPPRSHGELMEIAQDGLSKFPSGTALYVRPMIWAETGFVMPDADSARLCFSLFELPMPSADGFSVCLSKYRRPLPDMAPTLAKASCLYPNSGRALKEAGERGFDNAVVLDGLGNVAELATANIWIGKDGAAHTPIANGTFLAGITRRRVASLLEKSGIPVHERCITWEEVLEADEVFSTGNYGKVQPITRVEDQQRQPGPIYNRARELYWDWAHSG